ncbi:hypothetical protein ACHWQZ_G000128 [Mnemiopsis leidyi]
MPAPKPGGAKRVGGGAKRVGGGGAKGGRGAKAGAGARKGGGAAGGAKPKPKGRSIGGGLSVNVRNSHLVGGGSSMNLIKPLSTQHIFRGQQSREDLKRNPGRIPDTSPTRSQRESSERLYTGGSSAAGRYMRGLSVATDRMAMDRSMTNLFLACEEERHGPQDRNKFNGSSLNLSKRPNQAPSTSTQSPGLRDYGDNLRGNQQEKKDLLSKTQSDVDLATLEKNPDESDPLLKIMEQKFSILSPIMSIDSVTSSKSKHKKSGQDKWEMENGKREMGNGEWEMGNGNWKMGNGKWKMGNGKWEMRNGKWEMRNVKWDMGNGKCEMGNGKCEMGNGKWDMGNGKWEMGNVKCEMGNGKCEMGNGKWDMGNGKWGM